MPYARRELMLLELIEKIPQCITGAQKPYGFSLTIDLPDLLSKHTSLRTQVLSAQR